MSGLNPYSAGAFFIGSIIAISIFNLLFRYALLGRSGRRLHQALVVLLTGVVAIGFSAFGDGVGGFMNRITNVPSVEQIASYSLAALLFASLIWLRADKTSPASEHPKKGSIAGRAAALVIVVPMILIGLGNILGSSWSLAVNGRPPGPGLGVSHAEMREFMLNGDMGSFWRLVDERAPADMTYIIERLFENEDKFISIKDGRQQFNLELQRYRVSLAIYGPALSDQQRVEILESSLEVTRAFEDQPELCIDQIMTGGQGMSQEQLLSAKDLLNSAMIVMTENLIAARDTASGGASMPMPPTEADYEVLGVEMQARGMSEGQLQAVFNGDPTHPDYCSATIRFMEALINLEGSAGEALRFETMQAMLTGVP